MSSWTTAKIDQARSADQTVEECFSSSEDGQITDLAAALRLFIVCGGDPQRLANQMSRFTDFVIGQSVADPAPIHRWLRRLEELKRAVLDIPDCYLKEVRTLSDAITLNRTYSQQAVLRVIKRTSGKGLQLKNRSKKID